MAVVEMKLENPLYRPGSMAERQSKKDGYEIRLVGAKVTGSLESDLGREVLKSLAYAKTVVKSEPSQEYVEPLDSGERREILKMERQKSTFPQAGSSKVQSKEVSMRYSQVFQKYYVPSGIPDILEIKEKRVLVKTEEVKSRTEVLFKRNRRYVSSVKGQKYCRLCRKYMSSEVCLALHLRGRLHLKNVKLDLGLH